MLRGSVSDAFCCFRVNLKDIKTWLILVDLKLPGRRVQDLYQVTTQNNVFDVLWSLLHSPSFNPVPVISVLLDLLRMDALDSVFFESLFV